MLFSNARLISINSSVEGLFIIVVLLLDKDVDKDIDKNVDKDIDKDIL